jgi:hypothetical protein
MISAPGMSTSTTLRTFDEINKAYVDSVIQSVNKYGKAGKDACIAMYQHYGMDKLLGGESNGKRYIQLFQTNPDGSLHQDFILKSPYSDGLADVDRALIKEFMILNYRLTTLSQRSKKALDELSEQEKNQI